MKKTLWTALLVSVLGACTASAAIIINISEVGGNVVATASGSLDLTGEIVDTEIEWTFGSIADPFYTLLTVGSFSSSCSGVGYNGATSSGAMGSDVISSADSFSGDCVGVSHAGDSNILLPLGYVSGTALSGTATWNSTTIAALGFNTGTYTYNTANGTDSLTVNVGVVPEPATAGLLGLSCGALWLFRRLKNRYRS